MFIDLYYESTIKVWCLNLETVSLIFNQNKVITKTYLMYMTNYKIHYIGCLSAIIYVIKIITLTYSIYWAIMSESQKALLILPNGYIIT